MNQQQSRTIKIIGSVVFVCLLANAFQVLPQIYVVHLCGFLIAPLCTIVLFVANMRRLDRTAKIVGWLNVAFVVLISLVLII